MIIKFRRTSFGWCARIYLEEGTLYSCYYDKHLIDHEQENGDRFQFFWSYKPVVFTPDNYPFPV